MVRVLLCAAMALVLWPLGAWAATSWEMLADKSSLSFTAIQNGAPVKGEFTTFSGDIAFSKDNLAHSTVNIAIDMHSVSAPYEDIVSTLLSPDWFAVATYPQATFSADNFIKTAEGYQANGTLTLRGQTQPCVLEFSFDEYGADMAHAVGSATIQRTNFGVGQGGWADTDSIKDEVAVQFSIWAVPKMQAN